MSSSCSRRNGAKGGFAILLNKTREPFSEDVLRYRIHLESRSLTPGTVNLRLGAVRRPAYEAADCRFLSPHLAPGVRRVKGVKKLGVRLGNWLTPEQGEALWQTPDPSKLKGKRDRALLAVLLACGLRRLCAAGITSGRLFRRVNKAGRIWGESMSAKVVWHIVREFARKAGINAFDLP